MSPAQANPHKFYGGQALIEGVMIRTKDAVAVAVRTPTGDIQKVRLELPKWSKTRLRNIFGLRGVIILVESVVTGMRALNLSARIAYEEEGEREAADPNSKRVGEKIGFGFTLLLGLGLGLLLFLVLPNLAVLWLDGEDGFWLVANLIEGAVRIALFIGYIWVIGLLKDIKRMYAYHGAEHKTIAAAEHGDAGSIAAIRHYPKEHPRCGTALLITTALITLVVFSFLPREPLWLLFASRLAAIPFVLALSYEVIRWTSLHPSNFVAKILNLPNVLTQKLTTREPDDDMIEVALAAMELAEAMGDGVNERQRPSGAEASATDL